jgi:PhnB protein
MGTDVSESRGFKVKFGNNMFINLETDTRTESNRIFKLLAENGKVDTPLQEMF